MRLVQALPALVLLAATAARGEEQLLLYPSLGRPSLLTVAGRLATARPAAPLVEVALAGQVRRVRPAADGRFEATFAAPADRTFPVGILQARASAGRATATGEVQVVDDAAPFLVVLDLDDLPGLLRPPRRPGEAEASPPALAALLRCLLAGTRPAAAAVAVSARPPAEVEALRAALRRHGFPPLALRPQPGPGAAEAALRALLSTFPQPVVLLGDASGRAPARFAALAEEFPARVVATYLRASATGAADRRFEGATLFTDPAELARRVAARGVTDAGCAARLGAPDEGAVPAPAAGPAAEAVTPAAPTPEPGPASPPPLAPAPPAR